MTDARPLVKKGNIFNSNISSSIMCSDEITIITFLVEFLAPLNVKLLPVTLLHDGLLALSNEEIPDQTLREIEGGFQHFVKASTNMEAPISIKKMEYKN